MSVTTRPATEAEVEFLTTVVEATLERARPPDDFDEVDYHAGFGAWTSEQIGDDGAGASISVLQVDGQDTGRLHVVRRGGLGEITRL